MYFKSSPIVLKVNLFDIQVYRIVIYSEHTNKRVLVYIFLV